MNNIVGDERILTPVWGRWEIAVGHNHEER